MPGVEWAEIIMAVCRMPIADLRSREQEREAAKTPRQRINIREGKPAFPTAISCG